MLTNFKKLTKSDANVEVIVYGRLDLMYTEIVQLPMPRV